MIHVMQLMKDVVPVGEELMPHRESSNTSPAPQAEQASYNNTQGASRTTPIRKLSRNRGLVIRESVVEDSPEDDVAERSTRMLRCKRKIV